MRILKLTPALEKRLLQRRDSRDVHAEKVAAKIVRDVRRKGDAALFGWTRRLDQIELSGESVWASSVQVKRAAASVSREFSRAVEHAARNVRAVAEKQLPRGWSVEVEPGVTIQQMVKPVEAIGCYIPGGRAALVSTLVMTAVPAQVAGVRRVVAVCAKPSAELLAAARLLGVAEIASIGGAQAIAALAYGTRSIPRVEKIFGPGNRFVTAAKQLVSADCAIDLPAGPTEAVVIASGGNAQWIAADLLAQAEHAPDAGGFLVTDSATLAREVRDAVALQLKRLPHANPAHVSIRKSGAILLARSLEHAYEFVNLFAPEHVSIPEPMAGSLERISAAGTIFAGPWAAQPFGDYASGSNHVLPTGGWARRRGGLSASDFVKCITVQKISRVGFQSLAHDVQILAAAEGLTAHQRAVEIRQ